MADSRGEVTVLLGELKLGRKDALERLMPLVYREPRRVAGRCVRDKRPGHTLQPTALVHEAFLRSVDQDRADWRRAAGAGRTEEILAVDEILARLAELDPRQARIVELRYFGGLSVEETTEAMAISARTVKRGSAIAKAWMKTQLEMGGFR